MISELNKINLALFGIVRDDEFTLQQLKEQVSCLHVERNALRDKELAFDSYNWSYMNIYYHFRLTSLQRDIDILEKKIKELEEADN